MTDFTQKIDNKIKEIRENSEDNMGVIARDLLVVLKKGQSVGVWEALPADEREELADKLREAPLETHLSEGNREEWNNILTDLLKNN